MAGMATPYLERHSTAAAVEISLKAYTKTVLILNYKVAATRALYRYTG